MALGCIFAPMSGWIYEKLSYKKVLPIVYISFLTTIFAWHQLINNNIWNLVLFMIIWQMFVKLSLVGAMNYIIINCQSKSKFSFIAVAYNLGVAIGTITPVLAGIKIYNISMQYNIYFITVLFSLVSIISFCALHKKTKLIN